MKTLRNAERLIAYLREQSAPVTVAHVAEAGVMNSRDATHAVQYGVRHGAIERIKRPGARVTERVLYCLTGQPLQVRTEETLAPSFDALLMAWGIARVPPQLPGRVSVQVQTPD